MDIRIFPTPDDAARALAARIATALRQQPGEAEREQGGAEGEDRFHAGSVVTLCFSNTSALSPRRNGVVERGGVSLCWRNTKSSS